MRRPVVVLRLCQEEIASLDLDQEHLNPKGRLQEILQAAGAPSPSYEMLDQRGPDHRKEFVSRVFWQGEALGVGQGSSKKLAETAAAREALNHPVVVRLAGKIRPTLASAPVSPDHPPRSLAKTSNCGPSPENNPPCPPTDPGHPAIPSPPERLFAHALTAWNHLRNTDSDRSFALLLVRRRGRQS